MSLPPVAGPYLAATVLLGAAGAAKLARPADTANALRVARLPSRPGVVRAGAAGEVALALAALLWPGPVTGALVAAAYAAFAGFVTLALRRGWPLASCGCFGRPDTPPTAAHAALDAGAAVAAGWWAAAWSGQAAGSHLWQVFVHQPWHGAPLMILTLAVTGLAYLVWTDPLPAARR